MRYHASALISSRDSADIAARYMMYELIRHACRCEYDISRALGMARLYDAADAAERRAPLLRRPGDIFIFLD